MNACCLHELKCKFKAVGMVKTLGRPHKSLWATSTFAAVFLVRPLSWPNSDWSFVGEFAFPWTKLCFQPGNVRSHGQKRSLRPGNARLRKWQVWAPVMESSRTCPWPRGSSRTISIVLGLGLVDKVLEFTKDTYTSSADALNVQQNCRTSVTSTSE